MSRKLNFALTSFLLIAGCQTTAPLPAHAEPRPAASADSFVDSMGVATHFNYGDTPYGNLPMIKQRLGELGIRHIRDGSDRKAVYGILNDLHQTHGIKSTMLFGPARFWTIADGVNLLKLHPESIAGVEGPNESDLFRFTYNEVRSPEGARPYFNDFNAALKADAVTAKLPVIAPSVGRPGNEAKIAPLPFLDFQVMHSYAGGGLPSDQLDTKWIPSSNKIVGAGGVTRPIIATETGYHTAVGNTDGQPGVSEAAQAKYVPRLFGEYFNRGVRRSFLYELIDEGTEPKKSEANYGLLRHDFSPKPAFSALQNLIALLRETKTTAAFSPRALDFELSGDTKNVHHTLLQKSNGDYYLMLWQEVKVFQNNRSRPDKDQDLQNPDVPVTLTLKTPMTATAYLPNDGTEGKSLTMANNALNLNVPDRVLVVKLTPVAAPTDTQSPASPSGLKAAPTDTTIPLSWNAANGADGVTGYFVFRNGRFLGRAATTSFTDAELPKGLGYSYAIQAHDAAGNVSAAASIEAVTTGAAATDGAVGYAVAAPANVLAALNFEGLPGAWAEAESSAEHNDSKDSAGASGGKYVAWFAQNRVIRLTLDVKNAMPQANLLLRYVRGHKDAGPLDVYLAPSTVTKFDAAKAQRITLPPTGNWFDFKWAALPLDNIAAGKYHLFLRNPSGNGGGDFDVAALVPDRAYQPPKVKDGKFVKGEAGAAVMPVAASAANATPVVAPPVAPQQNAAPPGANQTRGESADREILEGTNLQSPTTETVGRVGARPGAGGGGKAVVYVFKLPALPAGGRVTKAQLAFSLGAKKDRNYGNADLYAVGTAARASVPPSLYYESAQADPKADRLLLQTDILTPQIPIGRVATSEAGNAALQLYLQGLYEAGKAGQFVFFRLNPKQNNFSSDRGYDISLADDLANAPILTIE